VERIRDAARRLSRVRLLGRFTRSARITWAPEFGKGRFALAYEDGLASLEMVLPFAEVRFDRERPGIFSVQREDGSVAETRHRVRTVDKNRKVIWRRPVRAPRGCRIPS
jgi:hypothetical protein